MRDLYGVTKHHLVAALNDARKKVREQYVLVLVMSPDDPALAGELRSLREMEQDAELLEINVAIAGHDRNDQPLLH